MAVVLTMLVAALFLVIDRAATADTAEKKVRWLGTALAVALVLPAGSWVYHTYIDTTERSIFTLYLAGDQADIAHASGIPGGPEQISGGILPMGASYDFECTAKDARQHLWVKSVAGNYWYDASLFTPVGDFKVSDMPPC